MPGADMAGVDMDSAGRTVGVGLGKRLRMNDYPAVQWVNRIVGYRILICLSTPLYV